MMRPGAGGSSWARRDYVCRCEFFFALACLLQGSTTFCLMKSWINCPNGGLRVRMAAMWISMYLIGSIDGFCNLRVICFKECAFSPSSRIQWSNVHSQTKICGAQFSINSSSRKSFVPLLSATMENFSKSIGRKYVVLRDATRPARPLVFPNERKNLQVSENAFNFYSHYRQLLN